MSYNSEIPMLLDMVFEQVRQYWHDFDFEGQFRYHPPMRAGCSWPLQASRQIHGRHVQAGEDPWLPCFWHKPEGPAGWRGAEERLLSLCAECSAAS